MICVSACSDLLGGVPINTFPHSIINESSFVHVPSSDNK